ncbi:membrane protein [Tsukamurella soli]|uniref:Membrane protein n=1 Tax=Tsukamurella soli TaxID=644556 RepID=A0ABP8JNE0_9ACTN
MAWAAGTALLVAAAFVVPRLESRGFRMRLVAEAAPIFGRFDPHVGVGTVPALVIAVVVVAWGPALAQRGPFPALAWGTALVLAGWSLALGTVGGWHSFATKLTGYDQYLHEVPGVHDIGYMLRSFARRIPDYQPDSWTVHVSGHPPGALLTFVWLDRIGLGGGTCAALFCVAAGASGAAAVLIAVRALSGEDVARSAAPFLALFPGGLWLAVSADAYFAGVVAWGLALLALSGVALHRGDRRGWAAAVGAGVLLGWAVYLNYGLVLVGIPALAVLAATRSARPLLAAVPAALAVTAAFLAGGFWWLAGYHGVVTRYYQGIASFRPFSYWIWGDLAAAACAFGVAGGAGIGRALAALGPRRESWRHRLRDRRVGLAAVVCASVAAMLVADVSALSKAEVERIWLPFTLWVTCGAGLVVIGRPRPTVSAWLAASAAGALLIAHLIRIYQ